MKKLLESQIQEKVKELRDFQIRKNNLKTQLDSLDSQIQKLNDEKQKIQETYDSTVGSRKHQIYIDGVQQEINRLKTFQQNQKLPNLPKKTVEPSRQNDDFIKKDYRITRLTKKRIYFIGAERTRELYTARYSRGDTITPLIVDEMIDREKIQEIYGSRNIDFREQAELQHD